MSGIVRCAGCRYRMRGAKVGQRKQRVYRCDRHRGAGKCPAPGYIDCDLLEQHVVGLFLAEAGRVRVTSSETAGDLEAGLAELEEAEQELAAFRDNERVRVSLERLGGGEFEAGLEARVDAVVAARQALSELRGRSVQPVAVDLAIWPDLGLQERRLVLAAAVDAVMVRRLGRVGTPPPVSERVRVLWSGEAPEDLPGPGRRVPFRSYDW